MNRRLFMLFAGALALASCTPAPNAASLPPKAQVYEKGMVSAADPRAAEAGAVMLRQGGTATDGAIATMLALTVSNRKAAGSAGAGSMSAPMRGAK
jgi:gamma-glutamyltranspeptidase / glutathione hydrolase